MSDPFTICRGCDKPRGFCDCVGIERRRGDAMARENADLKRRLEELTMRVGHYENLGVDQLVQENAELIRRLAESEAWAAELLSSVQDVTHRIGPASLVMWVRESLQRICNETKYHDGRKTLAVLEAELVEANEQARIELGENPCPRT